MIDTKQAQTLFGKIVWYYFIYKKDYGYEVSIVSGILTQIQVCQRIDGTTTYFGTNSGSQVIKEIFATFDECKEAAMDALERLHKGDKA